MSSTNPLPSPFNVAKNQRLVNWLFMMQEEGEQLY